MLNSLSLQYSDRHEFLSSLRSIVMKLHHIVTVLLEPRQPVIVPVDPDDARKQGSRKKGIQTAGGQDTTYISEAFKLGIRLHPFHLLISTSHPLSSSYSRPFSKSPSKMLPPSYSLSLPPRQPPSCSILTSRRR